MFRWLVRYVCYEKQFFAGRLFWTGVYSSRPANTRLWANRTNYVRTGALCGLKDNHCAETGGDSAVFADEGTPSVYHAILKRSGNYTALLLSLPHRCHRPRTYEAVQIPDIHPNRKNPSSAIEQGIVIRSHVSGQDVKVVNVRIVQTIFIRFPCPSTAMSLVKSTAVKGGSDPSKK